MTVNVRADGEVQLAGSSVESAELARRLQYEAANTAQPLEVRIRTDRSVPYRHVEPILSACARAGIWDVTFAVIAEETENRM